MARKGHLRTFVVATAAVTAVAIAVTGCGRKGPLERSEAAKASTQNYDPADDATVRGPRKPFILDRLLR